MLRTAKTWQQLHDELGLLGIEYRPKGSGAVLRGDGHVLKASLVDRAAGFGAMQKRLGAYEVPAAEAQRPTGSPAAPPRTPKPLRASPAEWTAYTEARTQHYDRKNVELLELRRRHESERVALRDAQRTERGQILDATRNRAARQAFRSVLAAEHASARADLRDKHQKEREVFREGHPRFPDLEQWLRERDPAAAGRWRYRSSEPGLLQGPQLVKPRPADIRDFAASIHGAQVHYHRRLVDAPTSFIDWGRAIHVHQTYDEGAVLASLQLAAQKWGRFKVHGDEEYKALCARLAAQHGFQLDNQELRERIAALREERAARRPAPAGADKAHAGRARDGDPRPPVPRVGSSPPPDCRDQLRSFTELFVPRGGPMPHRAPTNVQPGAKPAGEGDRHRAPAQQGSGHTPQVLAEFERYHAAVGADRYRVTAIRMSADGQRKAFILDKQRGETVGFTPDEIRTRMREMLRLEQRGENIYLTPLSASRHHILVDDMTKAKLDKFLAEGHKPAVVIESSPGNYQAVVNVPKLGTPHDREVGNRLSRELNTVYGDPNLSGAIHPHRAPGFTNRKPERRQGDGSYPVVRLVHAEARESDIDIETSRVILAQRDEATARAQTRAAQPTRPQPAPATSALTAYQEHQRDLATRFAGDVNYSRLDSMIALRLRATGHPQVAVAAAIEQFAPTIRPPEKQDSHDWHDYAQRTAAYAFGPGGDQQLDRTRRFHEQWRRLESQPIKSPETPASDKTPATEPRGPGGPEMDGP